MSLDTSVKENAFDCFLVASCDITAHHSFIKGPLIFKNDFNTLHLKLEQPEMKSPIWKGILDSSTSSRCDILSLRVPISLLGIPPPISISPHHLVLSEGIPHSPILRHIAALGYLKLIVYGYFGSTAVDSVAVRLAAAPFSALIYLVKRGL